MGGLRYNKVIIFFCTVTSCIYFTKYTSYKWHNLICKSVDISVKDELKQRFVTKSSVITQLKQSGIMPLIGKRVVKIASRDIINIIKSNPFVKKVIIYKNLIGDIKIEVTQKTPIARIIGNDDNSVYIDKKGEILPLSKQYTARILLVDVNDPTNRDKIYSSKSYHDIYKFLLYIYNNEFWRSQISYIEIYDTNRIKIHTQIGRQCIEFGHPKEIKEKFMKLHIFYNIIVPNKGWGTYKRVNLEFYNQIICE